MPIPDATAPRSLHVAFFLPSLGGGGAERSVVNLVADLADRGFEIELLLGRAEGPYLSRLPREVSVVDFGVASLRQALLPLARHLRRCRPDVLVSHMTYVNLIAVVSRALSRTRTRLVLVEHQTPSARREHLPEARSFRPLARLLHPRADAVVAVSRGAARDVEREYRLAPGSVRTIYNPVVDDALMDAAKVAPDHPWLRPPSPPVFLAVGSLTLQKDFETLLRAFASLRRERRARLVVLGEGGERTRLEALAADLSIAADVDFRGFVENPYAFMGRAAGLVLSSRFEALPTVLIEALACGCPVVSTACPTGPEEILESGRHGTLVPVGDPGALAAAMRALLDAPPDASSLAARVERGRFFSRARAAEQYVEVIAGEAARVSGGRSEPSERDRLVVRPMEVDDVGAVTAVHLEAFEGFFMSTLGGRFLRHYYRGIVDLSPFALVAVTGGRVAGFVVGVDSRSEFHQRLLRARGLRLLFAALPAAVRKPGALGRLARAPARRSPVEEDGVPTVHLTSLGVRRAEQGDGVATGLLEEFEALVVSKGHRRLVLETDAVDNERAVGFYARRGFRVRRTYRTREGRAMQELAKELPAGGQQPLPSATTRSVRQSRDTS